MHPGADVSLNIYHRFLSSFWKGLFCLNCFTLSWYLFEFHFFSTIFWFTLSFCIIVRWFGLFLQWCPFFSFFDTFFWAYIFFIKFSMQVLYFWSGSFGLYNFYHWRVFLQHRIDRFLWWFCLLGLLLLLLFTPFEFFTSVLADGFSLESEWQQVSSGLQDSSQDTGRSQQCWLLDSLYPSANLKVIQAF